MTSRPAPESSSSQRARILNLLIAARGGEVGLPEISALAAQYNARLFELRRLGFKIVNRTQEIDGVRHSWFRLLAGPASDTSTPSDAGRNALQSRSTLTEVPSRVVNPQTIPPNVKSDPREQLPLFSPKEDLR
jgi:hypothetical protein